MTRKNEIVVLVHGLANAPLTMSRLSGALRAEGYHVANWGYNSFKGHLHEQMGRLASRLPELNGYQRVHGIGHSLGGLMLRGLFSQAGNYLPLGRLVMLGTPNQGAGIVHRQAWMFRRGPLNRPIIHDLAPGSAALARLPVPEMEIGVIAGIEKFNPINPLTWLDRHTIGTMPHDGTVEAHNTRLPQMKDYLEVPVSHLALPMRRPVIAACLRFLATGSFSA